MAYRQAERQQRWLFPESIEEYISQEDPVRAYDAFVEALDVESLGIEVACADAGYSSADELEKIDAKGTRVIVPSSKQACGKEAGPYDKSRFRYVGEDDVYICPEGMRLSYGRLNRPRGQREYYPGRGVCVNCRHFGVCTKNVTTGRKIIRYENEAVREKLAAEYEEASSQGIYSARKEKVELPFGHIKRNLGVDSFLLRGLAGVGAEMSILCSCFNIARLIGLLGVSGLIFRLMQVRL